MSRYIDADKLSDLLRCSMYKMPNGILVGTKMLFALVEKSETADVRPVRRGRWMTNGIAAVCDQCGGSIVIEQYECEMNFCPNCGADMRGDQE